MSPELLEQKVLFLTPRERLRLAAWTSIIDRPKRLNKGRWTQMVDGTTDYLSHKELAALMDEAFPIGYALDILRGQSKVECL